MINNCISTPNYICVASRGMATGKQIKHYRHKLGWKLRDLTEVSEVDEGTISALEQRDSARSKYFPQIARAFGLTVEQLSDVDRDYDVKDPRTRAASAQSHHVAEAGDHGATEWPFRTITPQQFYGVEPDRLAVVEDMLRGFLAHADGATAAENEALHQRLLSKQREDAKALHRAQAGAAKKRRG